MKLSACIEWLYEAESSNFFDRVGLARQDGLTAIEFWTWTDKDISGIHEAVRSERMAISSMVAEPLIALTDKKNRNIFLEGFKGSVDLAKRLNVPVLIVQAGDDLTRVPRHDQKSSLTETLTLAADILQGSGVRVGLEPLNTHIDHPGYFLSSTSEALEIVRATGRDEVGIVYDIYHSAVMGEEPEVIGSNIDRIFHVHIADHPGRNEPGSGNLNLRERLRALSEQGYHEFVGLEFKPLCPTAMAVAQSKSLLEGWEH